MIEKQKTANIEKDKLLNRVAELYSAGYRLAQIGCTALENLEINYSFDKNYEFINLRLVVPKDSAKIPSITEIYWSAFIYENELHDLFGIKVKDMAVDYKGNFYQTAVKTPFMPKTDDKKEGESRE